MPMYRRQKSAAALLAGQAECNTVLVLRRRRFNSFPYSHMLDGKIHSVGPIDSMQLAVVFRTLCIVIDSHSMCCTYLSVCDSVCCCFLPGPAVALPGTECGTSTRPISHNMAEGADTPRHIASGKPTSSTRAADGAPHEYVLGTIQDLSPSQLSRLKASENVISQLESQTNAENAPEESWSKSPKSSPKKAISFEKSSQRRTETESKESRVASSASLNPRTGSYLQGSSVRHHAAGLGPVAARTGLAPFLRTSQQPLPSAAAATSKPLRTSTTKTHLHGTRASPKHSTRPQAAPVKSRPLQSGSKSGHQSSTGRPARRSLLRELQHPPSSQH